LTTGESLLAWDDSRGEFFVGHPRRLIRPNPASWRLQ